MAGAPHMPPNIELREEFRAAAEAMREEAARCIDVEERALLEAQANWWEARYMQTISGVVRVRKTPTGDAL